MRHVVFILFFYCFFSSCSFSIWDRYESLIQENPDSALTSLLSIDPERIHSSREKADYYLLLSMNLDKCYIDIASDSLITPAVSFYAKHRPLRKRMLAYYYLGRVQSNAHELIEASLSFETAEQYALQIQDNHYLGLIYQNLGDLYNYTFDQEHMVEYSKKALSAFQDSGEKLYIDNARLELALAYNSNNQVEMSEELFQDIISDDSIDQSIKKWAYRSYARLLANKDSDFAQQALSYFKKGDFSSYFATDYGAMATSTFFTGDTVLSRRYFSIADSLSKTDTEKAALDFFRYRISHFEGNDFLAVHYLEKSVTVQDSILRVLLNQSVSAARSAYYKNEAEKQLQRNRIQAGILVFVIACGILIILWLVLRHRNRIRNDMALIGEARQKLEESYHERNLLANSIINHQINELHLLTEEYYKSDSPARREKYFRAFEKRLDEFRRHDADLKGLEQSVNQLKGNAMKLLREEYPNETRHFYRMCTLFFAGLPYDMIHLLTKSSIPTLKAGKSHIRKQILSSNTPHQELFLSLLDSAEKKPAGRPKKD